MPFDKEGFLGKEAEQYKRKIINGNQGLFNLCFEIGRFAHDSTPDLQIHNRNPQEITLGCLLMKLLNNFDGIVILSSYGLVIEAKILLRSMLEVLFILKVCYKDKDFIKKYVESDQVYRNKLIKILKDKPDWLFDASIEYADIIEDKRERIKEDIKANDIKEIKVSELAKKAGLEDIYNTAYKVLCNTAHSGARSLEDYLILDDKEEIQGFNFRPIEKDLSLVLFTAMNTLHTGLDCIFDYFKINKKELEEFVQKLKQANINFMGGDKECQRQM